MKKQNYQNDIKKLIAFGNIPWKQMDKKKVLITGATGMIGTCLVDTLAVLSAEMEISVDIYILVRDSLRAKELFRDYLEYEYFHILEGDVCTKSDYPAADYVIHAASYGDPMAFSKDPTGVMRSNVEGTVRILEYARKNGARVVFISTGEVYGEVEKETEFCENAVGKVDFNGVRACYPESKRAAETLCHCYHAQYNADVVICRLCHIYGQTITERDSRVAAQFIRNAVNGEDIIMKSDGLQKRSMCYIVDAIGGILLVMLKGKNDEVYNVADKPVSIRQMAEYMTQIAGTKLTIAIPPEQEKRGYSKVRHLVLDSSKLKELGWIPQTKLRDGFQKVIEDLRG